MSLVKTLLPRSYMMDEAFENLTDIQHDIQRDFRGMLDLITGAYNIDILTEADLLKLMKSFSILDVYNALPPFYQGAEGYAVTLQGGKIGFMRTFIREMLKLRKDLGIVRMFDKVMGMLDVTNDSFIVLQDFWFHDESEGTETLESLAIFWRNVDDSIIAMIGAAPTYEKFFPSLVGGFEGDYHTPTQTVTLELLSGASLGLGDEFVHAIQTIINFLKPTFVVFKDIVPTVYLTTSGFYGMSMISRGDFVEPPIPDFRVPDPQPLTRNAWVVAATRKIYIITPDFITSGFMPGMIVNITGFTTPANNVTNARIVDMDPAGTWIQLNAEDCVGITNEGSGGTPIVSIHFSGDYDHSVQDALLPELMIEEVTNNLFAVVAPNKITRSSGSFFLQGWKVGMQVAVKGFATADNNIAETAEMHITDVLALTLTFDYTGFISEARSAIDVTMTQIDPYGMAEQTGTVKPHIETRSDTMHPVVHQPGPVPTLATDGSHMNGSASQRTERLDTTHYNNLNSVIGGASTESLVGPTSTTTSTTVI